MEGLRCPWEPHIKGAVSLPAYSEKSVIDSLYRISSLVNQTEDPGEALNFILDEVMRVLSPSSASISLINPDTNRLEIEVNKGLPLDPHGMDLKLGEGITGWVALHGRPLRIGNVSRESRYIQVNRKIRSEMAVPMEEQGMVIGVVNVDSVSLDAFTEDDLKILTLLTNEATKVVSKLWLIRQLKIKADQLQGLVGLGQALGGSVQLQHVLSTLAREGRRLMRARIGALFLIDAKTGENLELAAIHDVEDGPLDLKETLNLGESALRACVQFEKVVEISDLLKTDEPHLRDLIVERGLVSMMAAPVLSDQGVIGTLQVYLDHPHRFNNDERTIFQTLTRLGGVAIQNARLYKRVFESEEQLRKNEKLTTLGLLAAEIAHEVRNPLTVIKLLFESLDLDFQETDARHRDVQIITEKLEQLEETVGRVLDFGKTRQDMHARYDLVDLTRDTMALVRLKCRQNRIFLHLETGESGHATAPLWIEGNKGQLQQVLLNLIINATEAMPEGGDIRLRCRREVLHGQPVAVVEVADNGTGIPEDFRQQIFDSFLTRKKGGTGLGLSIVKRILRSHRGDIELVQSDSEGTAFRFWLPLREDD